MEEAYFLDALHMYGINPSSREIYLYGDYNADEEPGVDWRMGATFLRNLNYFERQDSEKDILIHMWTFGGEWDDGIAMYDAIKASPCNITILSYRAARSMSSVIFEAADRRVLMPNAGMMLHYGHVYMDKATGIELKTMVEQYKKDDQTMINIYADQMSTFARDKYKTHKGAVGHLERMFAKKSDWYLSSEEAVEHGLADGVFGTEGFETIEEIRSW